MNSIKKNPDYLLQHVDSASGFGLLYSQARGECVFLNPLATTLWKIPTDVVDLDREGQLFAEVCQLPDAKDYFAGVVSEMRQRCLLISSEENSLVDENGAQAGAKKGYPLGQLYFYATRECNARCYHCYQPTVRVEGGPRAAQDHQISREAFLKFVESALPLGLQHVKITGGEPLLRADLGDIIRGVREFGLHVSIETNGFLLTDELVEMFAEQMVDVSLSLDGGSAATHDKLRGFPGSFERTVQALRKLSAKGLEPKAIMSISRRNFGEVEKVLEVAAANGCSLVKLNPVNTLGLAQKLNKKEILLTVAEIRELYDRRQEMESKYGVFLFLEGPPAFASIYEIISGHAAICPFTSILGVLSDGSLSFCGIGNSCPELVFGRIDDENFDIRRFWQEAEALVQVRDLLSHKLVGVCGQCLLEPYCKGSCRALAYGEFGNFLSPHPWCQSAFNEGLFPSHYLKPQ
jgi:SynChlorMet cassette radical SAM/SPASM protein ScmF